MRYVAWDQLEGRPNVVVDGYPTDGTVLTLSHWRGSGSPQELAADLSTQIVFRYLEHPTGHAPADAVTNNHFDEDGLCGIYALLHPEPAMTERGLIEDVAAAGDFGTYRDRRAARIAFALGTYADEERSPFGAAFFRRPYPQQAAALYEELLERLPALLDDPEGMRAVWEWEDARLSRDEQRVRAGDVSIAEMPAIDLAVVSVRDGDVPHEMAINNATGCFRVAIVGDHRYEVRYRYETWVRYVSRPTMPRIDLAPLARRLTGADAAAWTFDGVDHITPRLWHDGASSLAPEAFVAEVERFLRG